jgi:lipoprotein-anchoring transpeptidase ErfK/SrfK
MSRIRLPAPLALWCAALAVVASLATGITAGAAGTAPTVKVYFGQGEQLTAVQRPGTTVQDALTALIAGPTPAEQKSGFRSYVPAGTRIRSVTVNGAIVTVDLGAGFLQGNAVDTTLARLDQVVSTATAIPGVTSVQLLIAGGTPLGLFPGIDATVALTPAALATPNVPSTPPASVPGGPVSAATKAIQARLAELGYLLPAGVDGAAGPATQAAVTAFQKWQGLPRTGTADERTRKSLAVAQRPAPIKQGAAGRRIEVLLDRQVVLAIQDNQVVRAVDTSTGKPSTPTTVGSFKVYAKYPRWWSTPFREWLLWAAPFDGGIAMHEFPDVPPFAASHGCVRINQADAKWLFDFVSVGTPVVVMARST